MKSLLLLSSIFLSSLHSTTAVLPTSIITIESRPATSTSISIDESYLASQALFGTAPNKQLQLAYRMPPSSDRGLCSPSLDPSFKPSPIDGEFVMFIARGNCTFEHKASNALNVYGASAVVVYNSVESMFLRNSSVLEFPIDRVDYECDNGEVYVDSSMLVQPFYDNANDALFTSCSSNNKCRSNKCVITGETKENDDTQMRACCVWDLHQYLYNDPTITINPPIPAVFVTIAQSVAIFNTLTAGAINNLELVLTVGERYRPEYNASSFILWGLGTCVACIAAYVSGSELRASIKRIKSSSSSSSSSTPNNQTSSSSLLAARTAYIGGGESLTLSPYHALGFIIISSTTLLILFYFNLYIMVTCMYAFGCSGALSQVLLLPFFKKVQKIGKHEKWDATVFTLPCDIGPVSKIDFVTSTLGYLLGSLWLYIALSPDSTTSPIYVIGQNVMGFCMCVLFLSIVRLPSLKVAGWLLIAAFVYDIFFVFITPLIFKKSVMITVATGGGGPTTDPLTCEKYPSTDGCVGGNPLPMLFSIPRIDDYQGGTSLLGIGDIVLPGLLLSFAYRFDLSKALVGLVYDSSSSSSDGRSDDGNSDDDGNGNGNSNSNTDEEERKKKNNTNNTLFGGYYAYVCVGYAVGLMMANMAVYIMSQGQPALLYLVPCTLGVILALAYKRGEVEEMWRGPRDMASADALLERGNGEGEGERRERRGEGEEEVEGDGGLGEERFGVALLSAQGAAAV